MLKIKDDVDLKELEKFGFCFDLQTNSWSYCDDYYHIIVRLDENRCICTRLQPMYVLSNLMSYSQLLFDLIQAGLVEKVEE